MTQPDHHISDEEGIVRKCSLVKDDEGQPGNRSLPESLQVRSEQQVCFVGHVVRCGFNKGFSFEECCRSRRWVLSYELHVLEISVNISSMYSVNIRTPLQTRAGIRKTFLYEL